MIHGACDGFGPIYAGGGGVLPYPWTSGKLGFPQSEENQDEERSIY